MAGGPKITELTVGGTGSNILHLIVSYDNAGSVEARRATIAALRAALFSDAVGPVLLSAGSATAPGLQIGDTDTGLFRRYSQTHLAIDGSDVLAFTPRGMRGALLNKTPNVALRNYVTARPWVQRTNSVDNNWYGVCWSPELGLFCAVAITGTGNRVMTSPDGATWTTRTSAADNSWISVCWSPELGLFCAVAITGTGNRVMTSPDGVTWTIRTSAADNNWRAVCWSPELGLFCAAAYSGSNNRIMTSPDGVAWTTRVSAANNSWYSVCWSPELGLFCAVAITGTGNRVMTSPDGITWTIRTSAADSTWTNVCWSPQLGLFAAIANSGTNRVMTSPDGISWTVGSASAAVSWHRLCWSPEIGQFCAVAYSGTNTRVMTSAPVSSGGVSGSTAANGRGLKHQRQTTGSIGAGASALVTVTWTTAFPDANYTVFASVLNSTAATASLKVVHIETQSASAVAVRVLNDSAGSLTGTLNVIAAHD